MILTRYSFLIVLIEAYVVGTHLNCLDKYMYLEDYEIT